MEKVETRLHFYMCWSSLIILLKLIPTYREHGVKGTAYNWRVHCWVLYLKTLVELNIYQNARRMSYWIYASISTKSDHLFCLVFQRLISFRKSVVYMIASLKDFFFNHLNVWWILTSDKRKINNSFLIVKTLGYWRPNLNFKI